MFNDRSVLSLLLQLASAVTIVLSVFYPLQRIYWRNKIIKIPPAANDNLIIRRLRQAALKSEFLGQNVKVADASATWSAFSPTHIDRRRWQYLKSQPMVRLSVFFLLLLFAITLFLPYFTNDKPIIIVFNQYWISPILQTIPETKFGGDFKTEADYRDPFVQDLIKKRGGWMIWPVIEFSNGTIDLALPESAPAPPSHRHWLGTDDQGRNLAARVLFGIRHLIFFGLACGILATFLGALVSLVQHAIGTRLKTLGYFVNFASALACMPLILIAMLLSVMVYGFTTNMIYNTVELDRFWFFVIVVSAFTWMNSAEAMTRILVSMNASDEALTAKALGITDGRLFYTRTMRETIFLLPYVVPSVAVYGMMTIVPLDFLGVGLGVSDPSIGEILAQAKNNLQAPWLVYSGALGYAMVLLPSILIAQSANRAGRATVKDLIGNRYTK